MKIKNIILVSMILLAVLTVGAVSASQNATDIVAGVEEFNDLAAVNESDELSVDSDIGEISAEEDDVNIGFTYVSKEVCIDDSESRIAYAGDTPIEGNVTIVIDDTYIYKKTFNAEDNVSDYVFTVGDLKKIPSVGLHKVNLTYQKDGITPPSNDVKNVNFTYSIRSTLSVGFFYPQMEDDVVERVYCGNDLKFAVYLPSDANGNLEVKFNEKKYVVAVKNGKANVKISKSDLKPGLNNITYTFLSSMKKYPNKSVSSYCVIDPVVTYSPEMSVGEKDTIDIISVKGTEVTVTLMDTKPIKFLAQYSFDEGRFSIPLEKVVCKGYNYFKLVFEIGNITTETWAYIEVQENSNGFKASISSAANYATVKLTTPKIKDFAEIYVDHKMVKKVSLKKGKATYKVSNLGLGKHNIKVLYFTSKKFFSKTFKVDVKYYVTLKAVKVKKSAKKLVLSATVKTTKKSKKGLKVTFKFNGKKYKAKTNAKGVAKATVKKKVLKKLKAGKKVKYQVTYLKHTVKKTAKIKK